jgi:hypothetical protein
MFPEAFEASSAGAAEDAAVVDVVLPPGPAQAVSALATAPALTRPRRLRRVMVVFGVISVSFV